MWLMLKDENYSHTLWQFVKSTHCEEGLNFFADACYYFSKFNVKSGDQNHMRDLVSENRGKLEKINNRGDFYKFIYDTYIPSDALQSINITVPCRQKLTELYETMAENNDNVYDDAWVNGAMNEAIKSDFRLITGEGWHQMKQDKETKKTIQEFYNKHQNEAK